MALTLSGYASAFNHPYEMGAFTEQIATGAFTKSLNEGARVHLVANHGGLPLASTDNGTRHLSQDSVGLKVAATLDPQDPDSAAIARKVASGLLTEMSFAFQAVRSSWSDDYTQRTVVEASLDRGDVSVVNFGASDATSVNVDGVADPPALSTNGSALTVEQRKARATLNGTGCGSSNRGGWRCRASRPQRPWRRRRGRSMSPTHRSGAAFVSSPRGSPAPWLR
jgi:HK97 family phage prohead protease